MIVSCQGPLQFSMDNLIYTEVIVAGGTRQLKMISDNRKPVSDPVGHGNFLQQMFDQKCAVKMDRIFLFIPLIFSC